MAYKVKEVKKGQEPAYIYYRKSYTPLCSELEKIKEKVDMNDYIKVCDWPIWRAPGHSDEVILESLFELFNWQHEGFQPNDEEIGFDKGEAKHTSMNVGDIIEINGQKYLCDMAGWTKVGA